MIVVSAYPLSGSFRDALAERYGEPRAFLTVPELRRLPPGRLLRTLRSGRGERCLLAVEDASSFGLVPVLETVGAVVGASALELVHPDLSAERIPRLRAAPALASLAAASVDGRRALSASRRTLAELSASDRLAVTAPRPLERLLFLNPNLWFGLKAGGSVGHVAGVVNGFARRGVQVTLASAAEPVLVDDGVEYRPLAPPPTFGLPAETNGYRLQRRLLDELDAATARSRLVYQRNTIGSYAGVQLSRRHNLPFVLEYNGSEVWAAEHWGSGLRYADVARAAEDVSLRHAHLVVTISQVLADEVAARGVERERIVCYPNCVDETLFDPVALAEPASAARRALGIADDAVVVSFLGTFGHWHGAERFAGAIARLRRDDAAWLEANRVHFLLIGDGLKMGEVRETLRDAGDVVTFTGLVAQGEAPALLAASDVLVSPHVPNPDGSPFFGSPTKLFEYMAAGKGIVASDLDQIGEILAGSLDVAALPGGPPGDPATEPALLVRPGSVDDLATGIRFLVDRPDWRAALGRNARALVLARYTWTRHVDAIAAGIERI